MIVPLEDKNNPLYGLTKDEQCIKLINWNSLGLKPQQIFSLDAIYTQNDIEKAYKNLAQHFHPDKNTHPDKAKTFNDAFCVLNNAFEYLTYELKSPEDQEKVRKTIRNNPFYQADGQSNFNSKNPYYGKFTTAYDVNKPGSTSTKSQMKNYEKMSFSELLEEAHESYKHPIPQDVIKELKRYILSDNSYLTTVISDITLHKQNLLQIAASKYDLDFFKWLIMQGADPLAIVENDPIEKGFFYDAILYASVNKGIDILKYLLQKFGETIFYNKSKNSLDALPLWWRLKFAIRYNEANVVHFLLIEAGYAKHVDNQKFDNEWFSLISSSKEDLSQINALFLEYGLLSDLNKCISYAIKNGKPDIAKQILIKHPEINRHINLFKLFELSIDSPLPDIQKSIDLVQYLINSSSISAFDLNSMLNKLIRTLNMHCTTKNTPQREIVLTLLPILVTMMHELPLMTEEQLSDQRENQRLHKRKKDTQLNKKHSDLERTEEHKYTIEEKEKTFKSVYSAVAQCAGHDTLKKLLTISKAPFYHTKALRNLLSVKREKLNNAEIRTLEFLINLSDSSLLLDATTNKIINKQDNDNQHINYTPLHLACEFNMREQALHIVEKMREENVPFDTICLKKETLLERPSMTKTTSQYHYTSLHLAIHKGDQKLAVKLIEANTNYKINAVIERRASYFQSFFSTVDRIEKSALEMAIEHNHTSVIRALQLVMLDAYIAERQAEKEEYLSHFTLFGYTLFRFGYYSKTTKLKEAIEFKNLLVEGDHAYPLDKINHGALSQGRLGEITQLSNFIKNPSTSQAYQNNHYGNRY